MNKDFQRIMEVLPRNAKTCIFGTNDVAKNLFSEIKKYRPDVLIKFFLNTYNIDNDFENGIPVYLAENLVEHIDEIDTGIVCSYSSNLFMKFILEIHGLKHIFSISEETPQKLEENNLFYSSQEENLYELLWQARKNTQLVSKIEKRFNDLYSSGWDSKLNHQYLDFINKDVIKTVADCGACHGLQSILFAQRFPNCEKVYAFEPSYDVEKFKTKLFDRIIKRDSRIQIVEKAVWNENTVLEFREDNDEIGSSSIMNVSETHKASDKIIKVPVTTLDNFVEENNIKKLDFIKMDLENSEQKALEGAEKTILSHRPQLAICIYHSDEQFLEIPKYLKAILTDYEFHFGHYSPTLCETILYAIPKELPPSFTPSC